MQIIPTLNEQRLIDHNASLLPFITTIQLVGCKSVEDLPFDGIYKLTNVLNGKSYIGRSKDCASRYDQHNKLKSGSIIITEAVRVYGQRNFTFAVIDKRNNAELESAYMKLYTTHWPAGYNKRHRSD